MAIRDHITYVLDLKLNKENVISKSELAAKCGVKPSAVTKWINGSSTPDIDLIPIISNELKIDALELLGLSDKDSINSFENRELLKKVLDNPDLYSVVKKYHPED